MESAYATSYQSVIVTSLVLHRFGDIAGFWCSWPHPYSTLILGVFPLHQIAHIGVSLSMKLKLFGRVIIFEVFQPMWSQYPVADLAVKNRGCNAPKPLWSSGLPSLSGLLISGIQKRALKSLIHTPHWRLYRVFQKTVPLFYFCD